MVTTKEECPLRLLRDYKLSTQARITVKRIVEALPTAPSSFCHKYAL